MELMLPIESTTALHDMRKDDKDDNVPSIPDMSYFQQQLREPYSRHDPLQHYSYPYSRPHVIQETHYTQPRTQQLIPDQLNTQGFQFPLNTSFLARNDMLSGSGTSPVLPQMATQHPFPGLSYPDVYHAQYNRSHSYGSPIPTMSQQFTMDYPIAANSVHKEENFTADDILILRSLLINGEKVKWRYISSRLSTSTGRRATSTTCLKKAKDIFSLPSENVSGSLGTSLPYVVHDSWNELIEEP